MRNGSHPHKKDTRRQPVDDLDDAIEARRLPHNLEAERSVLGAMLVSAKAADYGAERLKPEQFFREAHHRLFAGMQRLHEKRVPIDFVPLKEELSRSGDLDEVGGPSYIASLADGTPNAMNIPHYADIVADLSLRREVIYAASAVISEAYAGDVSSAALVQRADALFLDLDTAQHNAEDLVPQSVAVAEMAKGLERIIETRGAISGVPSGLEELDEMTHGFQRGDMILVPARPSMGKTALALNAAIASARAGYPVAFFSLEMKRSQVQYRMLSNISGVMLFKILRGFLGESDYTKISAAMEELRGLPIAIDDTPKLTMGDIRSRARRLKAAHGLGMVVIDYVQLVAGSDTRRNENRTGELNEISGRIKEVAKELDVPVVALAQLNRAAEGRPDSLPRLTDIRECDKFAQDADVVAILHASDHKKSGDRQLLLEKQRNGPTGLVMCSFDRDTQRFGKSEPHDDVPQEKPKPRPQASRPVTRRLPGTEAKG